MTDGSRRVVGLLSLLRYQQNIRAWSASALLLNGHRATEAVLITAAAGRKSVGLAPGRRADSAGPRSDGVARLVRELRPRGAARALRRRPDASRRCCPRP
jgi:hypothetical protein